MGNRPCPRCLIPLSRVQNLGTVLDKKHRKTMARVDDDKRRRNITTAREIIYEKNYAVDNEHVEVILKEQSLVPTVVRTATKMVLMTVLMLILRYRMRSRKGLPHSAFAFIQCLWWI